jgi:hypothetical protein
MKIKVLTILLFTFAISSCSAAPAKVTTAPVKTDKIQDDERPDWIDNPNLNYSKSRYLVAIGIGDTRTAAEDNARGNLAKIFQSDIRVEQSIFENIKEDEDDFSASMNLLKRTNVKSNQTLKNIQFGDAWFNSKEGRYYILAHLNRQQTAMIYSGEIEENRQKAKQAFTSAASEKGVFARFALLNKASSVLQINNLLNDQLRIISPADVSGEVDELATSVSNELRQTREKITCYVDVSGAEKDQVAAALKSMLSKFPFPVVDTKEESVLAFKAKLKLEDLELNTAGIFKSFDLEISMRDMVNQKDLETYTVSGREGHVTESGVIQRINRTVGKKIEGEYFSKLNKYIQSYTQ